MRKNNANNILLQLLGLVLTVERKVGLHKLLNFENQILQKEIKTPSQACTSCAILLAVTVAAKQNFHKKIMLQFHTKILYLEDL